MPDEKDFPAGSESPLQVWIPRIAGALVGGALVYYGRKPDRGFLGRVATTAGYSLLMKYVAQPAISGLLAAAPAVAGALSGRDGILSHTA